jgi:hypothetical protein
VDLSGLVGRSLQLDGSLSSDAEGAPLTFRWQPVAAPDGSLSRLDGAASSAPRFLPDLPGLYTFALTVNDGTQNSAVNQVAVTVSAIAPQTVSGELGLGRAVGEVGSIVSVPIYATALSNIWSLEIRFQFEATALRMINPADPQTRIVDAPIDPALLSRVAFTHTTDSNGTVLANDVLFQYIYDDRPTFSLQGTDLGPETILATVDFEILTPGAHGITIASASAFAADLSVAPCSAGTLARVTGYTAPSSEPLALAAISPAILTTGDPVVFDFSGSTLPDPVNTWIYVLADGEEILRTSFLEFIGLTLSEAGSSTLVFGLECDDQTVESAPLFLDVFQSFPGDLVLLPDDVALDLILAADDLFDFPRADLLFADPAVAAELSEEQLSALAAVSDSGTENDERSARLHPVSQMMVDGYYLDETNRFIYIPLTTGAASPYHSAFAASGLIAGDDAVLRIKISPAALDLMLAILLAPPSGGGSDPNGGGTPDI